MGTTEFINSFYKFYVYMWNVLRSIMDKPTSKRQTSYKFLIFLVLLLSFGCTYVFLIHPVVEYRDHIEEFPLSKLQEPQMPFKSMELQKDSTYSIVEIEKQNTFIALPADVDNSRPINIVLYSHGSITSVTKDIDEEFIQFLISYATYFTDKGYIFAASNEHAPGWGSKSVLADMDNTLSYILDTNNIEEDYRLNLLGYSMGGLSSFNYAIQSPDKVSSIALIAPTTRHNTWSGAEYTALKDIPIKIWHGTKDVNIFVGNSQNFALAAEKYDKEIQIELLQNETHWIKKITLKKSIFEFLEEE